MRVRVHKRKPSGGEVSAVPSNPTVKKVKEAWANMITTGRYTLGEPCAPYSLTHYDVQSGKLEKTNVTVYGRKIPLSDIRKKLLQQQEKYMRLFTDDTITNMTKEEVLQFFSSINATVDPTLPLEQLQDTMKQYQQTRTLTIWHDHATVLGRGYILITIHVLYDDAVFLTPAEVQSTKLSFCMLQHCIEEPEIHMIAGCSASVADQAALIPDRLECIQSIHLPVISSNGVPINDRLQFFIGDHPAQSFEQGTKNKCGSCGCPNSRMEDAAYALTLPCKSLEDLQSLVTAGCFGKTPNALRPLENLKVEDIRKELRLRKIYDLDKIKKDLQQQLDMILKGAQCVPTLLILNPTQNLTSLNPWRVHCSRL